MKDSMKSSDPSIISPTIFFGNTLLLQSSEKPFYKEKVLQMKKAYTPPNTEGATTRSVSSSHKTDEIKNLSV